jgi:hypothetical protein
MARAMVEVKVEVDTEVVAMVVQHTEVEVTEKEGEVVELV